ncbi:hypothetical protein E2562_036922 [Oryza meyeriana var. granulata]|uniref:Uncharacterized protein n=1 Tax=Oryza meyeriana var. granulata TaxID=110450 RepID=A0A6G1CLA7_9ORYZ|nr:hypothetical protein E2562_036922 [Oryza meyeriana var. granulata]
MEEDEIYAFVGLRAEDERAEQARLEAEKQKDSVTLNRFPHSCASTERVKTKMASYKWVAEKAIPFLKKDPNMSTKKLKEELETNYNVTIGYHTVWQDVKPYLETNHNLLWMRSKFSEEIKGDFITNNLAESWNKWMKDMKDLPVADGIRSKKMDLLSRRRKIDKSQWPKVNLGFKLLPPLTKRGVGRQRKNKIVGCLEKGGGSLGPKEELCQIRKTTRFN